MEPVTSGNTIGWYCGVPVLKPENFYIHFPETILDAEKRGEVVLTTYRKRPKLTFNS